MDQNTGKISFWAKGIGCHINRIRNYGYSVCSMKNINGKAKQSPTELPQRGLFFCVMQATKTAE